MKLSAAPRVTTTLVPLNICPTEHCQTAKPTPSKVIENHHHEQYRFGNKTKHSVIIHLIGDWIIRESSEPFSRKENEQSTPIEESIDREKKVASNEATSTYPSLPSNVNQWTVSFYFKGFFFS